MQTTTLIQQRLITKFQCNLEMLNISTNVVHAFKEQFFAIYTNVGTIQRETNVQFTWEALPYFMTFRDDNSFDF